jgi:hypothetical protein
MNATSLTPILRLDLIQRWEVYHRLQALEIACQCGVNQPLQVDIPSPAVLLQVWGVLKRVGASRQELIEKLENAWQLPEKSQ